MNATIKRSEPNERKSAGQINFEAVHRRGKWGDLTKRQRQRWEDAATSVECHTAPNAYKP